MSLQVWLPLLGNLKNQGANDITFSCTNTTNITTDTSGKIGSCYKRATKDNEGRIISSNNILLDGDLSMCCWAKVTDAGSSANGLVSNHSHSNNTGFGITVKQISSTDYRISCNTGNGSSRTYNTYYGTSNIKGEWHHLALTYNNTTKVFQLWVDGNVELTQSYTNSARNDKLIVFDWSTTYDSSSYRPACSLNDVRVYDHCLSTAEVKKLSRGLLLHYKLDGGDEVILPSQYEQLEYIQSSATQLIDTGIVPNSTYLYKFKYALLSVSGYTYVFGSYVDENTNSTRLISQSGSVKSLYLSCNCKAGSSAGATNITTAAGEIVEGEMSSNRYYLHNITTGTVVSAENVFTTAGTATTTTIKLFGNDSSKSNSKIYYFDTYSNGNLIQKLIPAKRIADGVIGMYDIVSNTFLTNTGTGTFISGGNYVLKDKIIDSSGYEHHGTITGAPTISSDSQRYSHSIYFDTNTYGTVDNIFDNTTLNSELTWCGWIYRDYNDSVARCLYNGIVQIWFHTNYSTRMSWNHATENSSTTNTSDMGQIIPYQQWTHLVWTFKDGYLKIYINGQYKNYSDRISTGQFIKGYRDNKIGTKTATEQQWIGKINDMRIYCTALSAADIKALYETDVRVASKKDIQAYMFDEAGSRELLSGAILTTAHNDKNSMYTGYTNGEIVLTGKSSIGSEYIDVFPTGKTYRWDAVITKDASNAFHLGFERYDASKTSRSDNACVYVITDSTAWTRKHVSGTVNLSTDTVNPCRFIALRILNDWSSANSRKATIHSVSLREVTTVQTPTIQNNGVFLLDELKEESDAKFYKNGFVESSNFIET